jgi:hypothetical protein
MVSHVHKIIVIIIYRYIVHVGMHMSEAVMVISAGMIPVDLAKSAQERLLLLQYQHITRQPWPCAGGILLGLLVILRCGW